MMAETNPTGIKKHDRKKEVTIRKASMYKDMVINAMKNELEFDSMIIKSNDEYPEKLLQADKLEYNILEENMKKAEIEEERLEIRDRMKEMKKERYEKDTENKRFYEDQQVSHRNHEIRLIATVAAVVVGTGVGVGAFKLKKQLGGISKNLITKC